MRAVTGLLLGAGVAMLPLCGGQRHPPALGGCPHGVETVVAQVRRSMR